jgi:hypothetical protein
MPKGLIVLLVGLTGLCLLASGPESHKAAASDTSAVIGRHTLQTRGIWTYFEDPGAPNGWYSGELLHGGVFESARADVARQLDRMRAMGVNEIVYELRSADPVWIPGERRPPECNVSPDTGLQWPQPTPDELANLGRLFDLASTKGIRIALILNNTHMEEQPPTNAETWLGSILRVVRDKPALDYVAFGGDKHLIDLDGDGRPESCGGLSEAPLWLGASSVQGRYVQWAIGYGSALGLRPAQLTAEAIVGFYPHEAQAPAGPEAEDGHLWSPVAVMRTIFDRLGTPEAERTYSLSFYEHRKCAGSFIPCTDEKAQDWSRETAAYVRSVIAQQSRATATEYGDLSPVDPAWPTETAVESLGLLMAQYGIDGGGFWKWVDETGDAPPSFGDPVKKRGLGYNPVQRELADLYGFHLAAIPNGSFEERLKAWTKRGHGSARIADLSQELAETPWRGGLVVSLRGKPFVSVVSTRIRVTAGLTYTTTGNFEAGRRSTVSFRYFRCNGRPSRSRAVTFGLPRTSAFRTSALRHKSPRDACYVQIVLATRSTLLADNIR